jgi:sigma-B regulation protein RsbU (phosphoserine phosphatase)
MVEFKIPPEVQLAAQVQRSMLPEKIPSVQGYSIWAYCNQACGVGGDMYDLQNLPTGEILILIADVAGKDISAALGMAYLAGMVPFALSENGADLCGFVRSLNEGIVRWASRIDTLITILVLALDPVRHKLRFANGAHPVAIFRRRDGTVGPLCPADKIDFPLGVAQGLSYRETTHDFHPSEALLLCSDGIIKARNDKGEEYGLSRLTVLLGQSRKDAEQVGNALLAELNLFAGNRPMEDDMTAVCISRKRL